MEAPTIMTWRSCGRASPPSKGAPVFLGPDHPAVRPYLEEGRGILADLQATVLLDRLDALVAAGETTSARDDARAAGDATGSTLRP